jgi:hypothetical protein
MTTTLFPPRSGFVQPLEPLAQAERQPSLACQSQHSGSGFGLAERPVRFCDTPAGIKKPLGKPLPTSLTHARGNI